MYKTGLNSFMVRWLDNSITRCHSELGSESQSDSSGFLWNPQNDKEKQCHSERKRRISFSSILPIVFCSLLIFSSSFAEVKVYFEGDVPSNLIGTLPDWIVSHPIDDCEWIVNINTKSKKFHNPGQSIACGILGSVILGGLCILVGESKDPWEQEEFGYPQILVPIYIGAGFASGYGIGTIWSEKIKFTDDFLFEHIVSGDRFQEHTEFVYPSNKPIQEISSSHTQSIRNVIVHFFRRKYQVIANESQKKESITHRPNLDYSLSLLENKSIWRGGEKVGFIITVENKGKGKGEVDVILSGDEYLLKLFGKAKSLGEIEPGKTKSEVFMVNLPTEPPTKEATLYIELKEKIWGESPMKKEVIRVSLLPSEKETPKPPPEPLLPAPNAFANKRPNAYCLIVGIQDYQQVGRLKYAQKDAEAFKYYCKGVLGIPESNIKTLYDQQATGLPLITAIRDWLGKKQNASMLVFYYSGHGAFNPDNPREDTFGYLVPVDGDPDLGIGTLISTKDIVSWLESSGVDTILVILDACFSGNPDMGKTPQIAQKAGISAQIVAPPSRKAIILTSTTSAKPSLEYDEAGYSYFTYYLLQGLKGKADKDPADGWITIDEAYNYACEHTESATEGRQVPLKSGSQCDIRLGRYK